MIYFNIKKHPLDVKKFRDALAYATNREEMVKTVIGEKYGEPQYSLIASALEFWIIRIYQNMSLT